MKGMLINNREIQNIILKISAGDYPSDEDGNITTLPHNITGFNNNSEELQENIVEFVYEGIEENSRYGLIKNRCILCPHKDSIAEINDQIMDLLTGEETIVYTAGTPNIHDEDGGIPVEFPNSLNYLGCPKYRLQNINEKQEGFATEPI